MTRLAQLTKLHQLEPTDPFCTYGIALEHAKAQEFDAAIQWLDKTLEIDADYAYAYFQKAKMLIEKGEDEPAREVLRIGIDRAKKKGTPDSLHGAEEMTALLQSVE
ncbi:MAG: hypothetical protein K8S99_04870 [Planctomycetes bacterium]|nr:hypothetical protein [Planctomycetota bacterium]